MPPKFCSDVAAPYQEPIMRARGWEMNGLVEIVAKVRGTGVETYLAMCVFQSWLTN